VRQSLLAGRQVHLSEIDAADDVVPNRRNHRIRSSMV
jgi:hypothetical protein